MNLSTTATIGDRMMEATDYADTIAYASDFAEGLELEATFGNPADTDRLLQAAAKFRAAIALLQPLAEVDQ